MPYLEVVTNLQGLAVDVDELFLLGGNERLQGFQIVVETDSAGLLDDLAHEDHIDQGGDVPKFLAAGKAVETTSKLWLGEY